MCICGIWLPIELVRSLLSSHEGIFFIASCVRISVTPQAQLAII